MKQYNILVILDPKILADHLESAQERLEGLIKNSGGLVLGMEHGGLRKFAYPIRRQTSGAYLLFRGELEPEKVADLQTKIILDKEVLRLSINEGTTLSFQERVIARQLSRPSLSEIKPESKSETTAVPETKPMAPTAIQLEELEKKVEEILKQPKI